MTFFLLKILGFQTLGKNPKFFHCDFGWDIERNKRARSSSPHDTSSSKMATTTTTLYQSIEPEIKDISLLAKGTFNYGGFFSSASSSGSANAQPEIRELGERVFSQIRAVARHTNEREWFSEHEVMSERVFLLLFSSFLRFDAMVLSKSALESERERDGRTELVSLAREICWINGCPERSRRERERLAEVSLERVGS